MTATKHHEHWFDISGTSVRAFVVKSRRAPGWWSYTLFDGNGKLLTSDSIDLSAILYDLTPQKVANIVFILEEERIK